MKQNQGGRKPPEQKAHIRRSRVRDFREAQMKKRLRRLGSAAGAAAVLVVLALSIVFFYTSGMFHSAVRAAWDVMDSARIAMLPAQDYPQKTGIDAIYQLEELSGGFVALGREGCVVYAADGNRLNLVQTGYARPALAVGKTRYVLYNRSGNELRVESRTKNLYVHKMDDNIYLCAVAPNGSLAVVTDAVHYTAQLTVYSETMQEKLTWGLSSTEGVPLRMAFADDSSRLAVAAVTTQDGQAHTGIYLLDTRRGDAACLDTVTGSIPEWIGWVDSRQLLVVYDSGAVLYSDKGARQAEVSFPDMELSGVSVDNGALALLFTMGQNGHVMTLDKNLRVQFDGSVPAARRITRAGKQFYLLGESTVECYSMEGEFQWMQEFAAKPQAVLSAKQTLVFTGSAVDQLAPPEEEKKKA